jgi:hypothetical protein
MRRVDIGGGSFGIVAVDLLEGAWQLRMTSAEAQAPRDWPRLRVTDAAGNEYGPDGAGGSATDMHFGFAPAIDASTPNVRCSIEFRGEVTDVELFVPTPTSQGAAQLLRVERWPSPRWPVEMSDGWRPKPRPRFPLLDGGATLPEEIVPLGAPVGAVMGRGLVCMSIERWQSTWVLHHFSTRDTPNYSPLLCTYVELDLLDATVVATMLGGGSAGVGFMTHHAFESHARPDRFVLRRPANDGGPPLIEVEVSLPP